MMSQQSKNLIVDEVLVSTNGVSHYQHGDEREHVRPDFSAQQAVEDFETRIRVRVLEAQTHLVFPRSLNVTSRISYMVMEKERDGR